MGRARNYDNSVFINCPFDEDYEEIFDALVFAVRDCGFVARCALEVDDSSQTRIGKILRIVGECRFGIHDISRTEPSKRSGLPRFNMPLELGLFLGAKEFGIGEQQEKSCLVLDRDRHRFQEYISDIGGQDIRSHGNNPGTAIGCVRDWLNTTSVTDGIILPGPAEIVERYVQFRKDLPRQCERVKVKPDELTFVDLEILAYAWLKENPLD